MRLVRMAFAALALAAAGPLAVPAHAQDAAERQAWEAARASNDAAQVDAFLQQFPNGVFAPKARLLLQALGGAPHQAEPAQQTGTAAPLVAPDAPAGDTGQAPAQPTLAFGPRVATDKAAYAPFEPIEATWAGIMAPSGTVILMNQSTGYAADTEYVTFSDGNASGSTTFAGQMPGLYEAQVVASTGSYILARQAVTVSSTALPDTPPDYVPLLQADRQTYSPFEPITVTWSGVHAGSSIIRLVGDDPDYPLDSEYLTFEPDRTSGSVTLDGQLPGAYQIQIVPGSEGYVLASTAVQVVDPNQANAGPARPAAGTPVPISSLGGIRFADPPVIGAIDRFAGLIGAVSGAAGACEQPEAYVWKVTEADQPRIDAIMSGAQQSLTAAGYDVQQQAADIPGALVTKATAEGKPPLLVSWYLSAPDLYLLVCQTQ